MCCALHPMLIAFYLVHNSLLTVWHSTTKIKTIYKKKKSMKTPTKCEIVPIKPTKSWRPIKRRSYKSCPPETVSSLHSWSIHSFASSVLLFGLRASSRGVSGRDPWLKSSKWRNSLSPFDLCRRYELVASRRLVFNCVPFLFFRVFFFFPFKPKLRLNHPQACCTWLISSPKRSNSPSTQAPFSRHFCTVSSWPSSPVCTRNDAIWGANDQKWCNVKS